MRASKDIAKRLRYDRFPRPDLFRRLYLVVGAAAAVAGLAAWLLFTGSFRQRQYLPGPVSQNHATFGDRCEKCHDQFHTVSNKACLECHTARVHSEFEVDTPRCRDCHVEHRAAAVFLSVSNRTCIECHAQLTSKRQPQALVQTTIRSFAAHPQFAALREGHSDRAAVRFNHKIHLTSDKIARDDKLSCAKCHQPERDGKYMQPILFETHCKRCHEQKPPNPIGGIEAPHKAPDAVHDGLASQLVVIAVQNPEAIFVGRESTLPGVPPRPPVSEARSLRTFQDEWLNKLETALYKPFEDTAPLLERNKYCFLCHLEDGERSAGELPKVKETKIPRRWLPRGEFSHRKHDMVACKTCHDHVETSVLTSDVNLPKRELCQRCHADDTHETAGTSCMLCHLYHDTSKTPDLRITKAKDISLDVLTGH